MGPKAHAAHFRAYPRRTVRLRAVVARSDTSWRKEAHVHDLSLGGVSLTLTESLRIGDHVTVSFLAPTLWDPLALPARVAWVRPATATEAVVAVGLAFEPQDPASVLALFELVSTLAF
jgi:Tfp pilus assembly protein PilZ